MKFSFVVSLSFLFLTIGCGQTEYTSEEQVLHIMPDEMMDSAYFERHKELPRISIQYTQALTDYIDTTFATVKPDTLFIMTIDQGYDVTFPEEIRGIKIGYYPEENYTQEAIERRKKTVSLNIAGWPELLKSEFIFVTFFSDAKPQHNFHSYYSRKDTTQAFVKDSAWFEYQYDNTTPLVEYLGK